MLSSETPDVARSVSFSLSAGSACYPSLTGPVSVRIRPGS